jgi:hypothetical protein
MGAMVEEALTGGNLTPVVRVGETVRRPVGSWTPAVHALLRRLESVGFDRAPRVLGIDAAGRELLTFLEGEVGAYPLPDDLWAGAVLLDAARLLRRFHDATAGWRSPPDAAWQFVYPDAARHEVICHNDIAPYNAVFVGGRLRGVIDFDTAGPGPRRWDIAHAAYRFVPLHGESPWAPTDQARRLRRFCDAYGLADREGLVEEIERRVRALGDLIRERADRGDPTFRRLLAERHAAFYGREVAYLRRQRPLLDGALVGECRPPV